MKAPLFASTLMATYLVALPAQAKLTPAPAPQANVQTVLLSALGRRDSGKKEDLAEVKKMNGKVVKIPGFMVPLTPDKKDPQAAIDFLFVPGLQSCIHVPPPPPSQTVYVKMKEGQKAKMTWDPIWVTGTLSVLDKASKDNPDALYTLKGESTNALNEKDRKDIYESMLKDQASRFDCNGRDKREPVCQAQREELKRGRGGT